MPGHGLALFFPSQLAWSTPTLLAALVPIVPGFLVLDDLGLLITMAVVAVTLVLLLSAPSTRVVFHYSMLMVFFLLVTVVTVGALNVLVFYVAWELTALVAWGIGRLADEDARLDAGVIPFHAAGALASFSMFMGLLLAVAASGSLALADLALGSVRYANALILAAIFFKTYGVLTEGWSPVPHTRLSLANATLAGAAVLVIGLYPFLRLFADLQRDATGWREIVGPLAAVVAILAALAALGHSDLRRALSYAALSQFAALLLAFSHGTEQVVRGATIGVFTYALGITGLALTLGIAEAATHQFNIRRIGGLSQQMPLVAALFLVFAYSLVGLPPLGGFISAGAIGAGLVELTTDWLPAAWLAVSILLLLTFARIFVRVFLGELRAPAGPRRYWSALFALVMLVTALTFIGLRPADTLGWLTPTAIQTTG